MLKYGLKVAIFAIFGSLLVPMNSLTQNIPESQTQIKSNKADYEKAKKELPTNWFALYEISDKIARANGQDKRAWRIVITSEYNPKAFSTDSSIIPIYSSIANKLTGDSAALACVISREMGHHIKQHQVLSEVEKQAQLRRISDETQEETEIRTREIEKKAYRTRSVMGTIGGIFGRTRTPVDDVGREVTDEIFDYDKKEIYQEIYQEKKQELEASWQENNRQQELEADEIGYLYSAKAGFDSEGCNRAIEAIASMPDIDSNLLFAPISERQKNLKKLMKKYPAEKLAQEGTTIITNSQPLNYYLSGNNSSLQIGDNTLSTSTSQSSVNSSNSNSSISFQSSQDTVTEDGLFFSNRPFSSGENVPIKQEFNAGETIYGRLTFDTPIYRFSGSSYEDRNKETNLYIRYWIYGLYADKWYEIGEEWDIRPVVTVEQKQQNYFDFDIIPEPGKRVSDPEAITLLDYLDSQDFFKKWHYENPGHQPMTTYRVIFDAHGIQKDFYLQVTPGGLEALETRYEQDEALMNQQKITATQLPGWFNTPLVPFRDPQLSVANLRNKLGKYGKILKLAISPDDADYTPLYNEQNGFNVMIGKITLRDIGVAYQEPNGKCFYRIVSFSRDYLGGGNYGELRQAPGGFTAIACENIR